MVRLDLYTVSAFSSSAFGGNPAAVVPLRLGDTLDDGAMQVRRRRPCQLPQLPNQPPAVHSVAQAIADQMQLSETCFVSEKTAEHPFGSGRRFGLRWFTPTREVPLCGHGTLATAAVVFEELQLAGCARGGITFETLSGDLVVTKTPGGYSMDLP